MAALVPKSKLVRSTGADTYSTHRVYSYEGTMGSGKTTMAVNQALCLYFSSKGTNRPIKIISNIELLGVPYDHFTLEYLVEHMPEDDKTMDNSVIIFDESYQLFGNRETATKTNKLFCDFIPQIRKRKAILILCTHSIDNIDKKIKKFIDVRCSCQGYTADPCDGCKGLGTDSKGAACLKCLGKGKYFIVETYCQELRRNRSIWKLQLLGNTVWDYFRTEDRVPMQKRKLNIDTAEV